MYGLLDGDECCLLVCTAVFHGKVRPTPPNPVLFSLFSLMGEMAKHMFFAKKDSIDEIVVLCHNRRCQQYDCFSLPCFHEFQTPCCECLVAGGVLSTGPSRQRGTVSLSPLPVVRHRTAKAANDFKVWSSPSGRCNLVMFAIFLQMCRTKSTL